MASTGVCAWCGRLRRAAWGRRWLSASARTAASRSSKFYRQPLEAKGRSQLPTVMVWDGMSVAQLARLMDKDADRILRVIRDVNLPGVDKQLLERADTGLPIKLIKVIAEMERFRIRETTVATSRFSGAVLDRPGEDDALPRRPAEPGKCVPRCPVVTIMGHVDHGKTTLLDALRHSQIVAGEFGGITQHIGAFSVRLPATGERITFLDTPGHAAFHAMRQRGADATDMVVLVVAAEDGVMEQTVESLRFARNAGVPLIVAVNKCDLGRGDLTAIQRSLMTHDVVTEEFDGDVQLVRISALTGMGLDELQEAIVAQAAVMELKAEADGAVEGVVIESRTLQGRGKASTVLVQRGTLTKGRVLVAGEGWCRVRAIFDERGRQLERVAPGEPAEIIGWHEELAPPGELMLEVDSEKRAKAVVAYRHRRKMEAKADFVDPAVAARRQADFDEYKERRMEKMRLGYRSRAHPRSTFHNRQPDAIDAVGGLPQLTLLVRADVEGSVEALVDVLSSYNADEQCRLDVAEFAVGPPVDADVDMASAIGGIIYCFNVDVPKSVRQAAALHNVQLREFNVIYHLVADLKERLDERLPQLEVDHVFGEGEVIVEHMVSGLLTSRSRKVPVAGVRCSRGIFDRKKSFRFDRRDGPYFEGEVLSMQVERDIVQTVAAGFDVGIRLADAEIRFRVGDKVVCFEKRQQAQHTRWRPPGF